MTHALVAGKGGLYEWAPMGRGMALIIAAVLALSSCASVSDNPKTAIGGLGGDGSGSLTIEELDIYIRSKK